MKLSYIILLVLSLEIADAFVLEHRTSPKNKVLLSVDNTHRTVSIASMLDNISLEVSSPNLDQILTKCDAFDKQHVFPDETDPAETYHLELKVFSELNEQEVRASLSRTSKIQPSDLKNYRLFLDYNLRNLYPSVKFKKNSRTRVYIQKFLSSRGKLDRSEQAERNFEDVTEQILSESVQSFSNGVLKFSTRFISIACDLINSEIDVNLKFTNTYPTLMSTRLREDKMSVDNIIEKWNKKIDKNNVKTPLQKLLLLGISLGEYKQYYPDLIENLQTGLIRILTSDTLSIEVDIFRNYMLHIARQPSPAVTTENIEINF